MEILIDTIETFIQENPEYLKKYSEKELRLICTSPFAFVKHQMNICDLSSIRLKHFGEFKVYKGSMRTAWKRAYQKDLITETEYQNLLKSIEYD